MNTTSFINSILRILLIRFKSTNFANVQVNSPLINNVHINNTRTVDSSQGLPTFHQTRTSNRSIVRVLTRQKRNTTNSIKNLLSVDSRVRRSYVIQINFAS